MTDEVEDLRNRVQALEEVVVSMAVLMETKDVATRPEMFRIFMKLIRDADERAVKDTEREKLTDSKYRPLTPVAVKIEELKTDFMNNT